jgi:hypothetical protein
MTGFSSFLGWAGCIALAVILYRGYKNGLRGVFPVFYGYCAFVLCWMLIGIAQLAAWPEHYITFYWIVELCSVVWGVGVIAELYNHTLSSFPGALRFTQMLLLLLTAAVLAGTIWAGREISIANTLEAERALRGLQATLLVLFFITIVYFDLPLDRNVRGIVIGYSWVVATSIPSLSMRSFWGESFQRIWEYAQPLEYFVSLMIWCAALWESVQPARTAAVASQTVNLSNSEAEQSLDQLRRHLVRSSRQ